MQFYWKFFELWPEGSFNMSWEWILNIYFPQSSTYALMAILYLTRDRSEKKSLSRLQINIATYNNSIFYILQLFIFILSLEEKEVLINLIKLIIKHMLSSSVPISMWFTKVIYMVSLFILLRQHFIFHNHLLTKPRNLFISLFSWILGVSLT